MIRVGIADDHDELRTALRLLLALSKEIDVVFEAANGFEVVDLVRQHRPDILVMDIYMPELNGFSAARQISDLSLPTRIILISTMEGFDIYHKAKAEGARGFVPKSELIDRLHEAIITVCQGDLFFPEV